MFTRIAAGLLLCALAAPAAAQQIYKCVTKTGAEYQSTPCTNGEAAKTWAVEVAPRSEGVIENERRLDAIRQQNSASIAPRHVPARPVEQSLWDLGVTWGCDDRLTRKRFLDEGEQAFLAVLIEFGKYVVEQCNRCRIVGIRECLGFE